LGPAKVEKAMIISHQAFVIALECPLRSIPAYVIEFL